MSVGTGRVWGRNRGPAHDGTEDRRARAVHQLLTGCGRAVGSVGAAAGELCRFRLFCLGWPGSGPIFPQSSTLAQPDRPPALMRPLFGYAASAGPLPGAPGTVQIQPFLDHLSASLATGPQVTSPASVPPLGQRLQNFAVRPTSNACNYAIASRLGGSHCGRLHQDKTSRLEHVAESCQLLGVQWQERKAWIPS